MPLAMLRRLVGGGEPWMSRLRLQAWPTIAIALLAGCGTDEYEARLANTSVLYKHLDLLDSQLQSEWGHPQGIRLRLPPQFTELPAPPPPPKPVKGAAAPVVIDDRQPQYMNLELPGLRGAFLAKLSVLSSSHERIEVPGHVYVLSNHGAGAKAAQSMKKSCGGSARQRICRCLRRGATNGERRLIPRQRRRLYGPCPMRWSR